MTYRIDVSDEFAPRVRSIDWDLQAALLNNPTQHFTVDDIAAVLAVHEGERDEENWVWIVQFTNPVGTLFADGPSTLFSFALLEGGCDYTGWDCQSWLDYDLVETPTDALNLIVADALRDELASQLEDGKQETWREQMDKVMRRD